MISRNARRRLLEQMENKNVFEMALFPALLAVVLAPGAALGCACGCGVFDVATSSMFPQGPGGMAFLDGDFSDQKHNWHGTSDAPSANRARLASRAEITPVDCLAGKSHGSKLEQQVDAPIGGWSLALPAGAC
jgi:hypothetical protein